MNGDRNTRFFHSLVKERRHKLKVNRIKNSQGCWLEDEGEITTEATKFFQHQFQQERDSTNFTLLDHVPEMVNADENSLLEVILDSTEVKNIVLSSIVIVHVGLMGSEEEFFKNAGT